MALTLIEAAKAETGDVVRQAIIELFARSHALLANIPFIDVPGGAYQYNQEEELPGIAFRGVNEAFPESTGVLNPMTERIVIAGGDIDVDRAIQKMNGSGTRAIQTAMKVKSMAHTIAHKMIKGDSETNVKEFDGLQKRLVGTQLIPAGNSAGGDACSLSLMDATKDQVVEPTHWLMSKAMGRRFSQAARDSAVAGFVTREKDTFGQRVVLYDDLPIIFMDDTSHVYKTLGFDEVSPGGGASVSTSIYCLSMREGQMQGLQNGEMEVRDLGEQNDKPVDRTRVEWLTGLALLTGNSAARYHGIKDAAIVA